MVFRMKQAPDLRKFGANRYEHYEPLSPLDL